jgi:hypothetical protein
MDFYAVIANLQNDLPLLKTLVDAIAYVSGSVLTVVGIMQLKAFADQKVPGSAPVWTLIAAALLMAIPSAGGVLVESLYGSAAGSPLSYVRSDAGGGTLKPVLALVNFIGYIAFVRGIFVLRGLGDVHRKGQFSLAMAMTFMIGGVACVHIDYTIKVIAGTIGWNVSSFLN